MKEENLKQKIVKRAVKTAPPRETPKPTAPAKDKDIDAELGKILSDDLNL